MSGLSGEAIARKSEELISLLKAKFGAHLLEARVDLGDSVVRIAPGSSVEFFKLLKLDSELKFNMLVDLTAVDWVDSKPERFDVVYQFLSLSTLHRLRVEIALPEENPEIDTISALWPGGNFMEREAWDMYGIKFRGHPDLRRILTYDEFVGHPLRKDYPVQGKQPRIPMRSPEVRNTALDMKRPALVGINPRRNKEAI